MRMAEKMLIRSISVIIRMILTKQKLYSMPCLNSFLLLRTTLNSNAMKHLLYKPYILFILIVAIFSSCEKVIDLKLDNAEKKYVIEGIVTDQAGTAKVLISQTKNFDEGNSFIGIPGATVT